MFSFQCGGRRSRFCSFGSGCLHISLSLALLNALAIEDAAADGNLVRQKGRHYFEERQKLMQVDSRTAAATIRADGEVDREGLTSRNDHVGEDELLRSGTLNAWADANAVVDGSGLARTTVTAHGEVDRAAFINRNGHVAEGEFAHLLVRSGKPYHMSVDEAESSGDLVESEVVVREESMLDWLTRGASQSVLTQLSSRLATVMNISYEQAQLKKVNMTIAVGAFAACLFVVLVAGFAFYYKQRPLAREIPNSPRSRAAHLVPLSGDEQTVKKKAPESVLTGSALAKSPTPRQDEAAGTYASSRLKAPKPQQAASDAGQDAKEETAADTKKKPAPRSPRQKYKDERQQFQMDW